MLVSTKINPHGATVDEHKCIVCGRGSKRYNSKGNKTLRNLVGSLLAFYIDRSTARSEKTKLVEKVCKQLFAAGMLFVIQTIPSGERGQGSALCIWEELSYTRARSKVAHRFRDAAHRVHAGEDTLPFSFPAHRSEAASTPNTEVGSPDSDDSSFLSIVSNDRQMNDYLPSSKKLSNIQPLQGMIWPRWAAQSAIKTNKIAAASTDGARRSHSPLDVVPLSVALPSPFLEELCLVSADEEHMEPRMVGAQLPTTEDASSTIKDDFYGTWVALSSKNHDGVGLLHDLVHESPPNSLVNNIFLHHERQAERDEVSECSDKYSLYELLEDDALFDDSDDEVHRCDEIDETTQACHVTANLFESMEKVERVNLASSFAAASN